MAKQTYTSGQVLTAAQMTTLQANDYNQTVSAKTASYVLVAADAGTTITMSNVGATTITVNTALFTAGDTLKILNINTGLLTVTAGTATVGCASVGGLVLGLNESGILYFSAPGASIFLLSGSVSLNATQTLQGKTLQSPAISGTSSGAVALTSQGGTDLNLHAGSNQRLQCFAGGAVKTLGGFAIGGNIGIQTAAAVTLGRTVTIVRFATTATCTVTLPTITASASNTNIDGMFYHLMTTTAFAINSASANIYPKTSNAVPVTAILPATAGAWCILVADSNFAGWVIMASGT